MRFRSAAAWLGNFALSICLAYCCSIQSAQSQATSTNTAQGQAPSPNKPNVIFIFTDDLGYGDLGGLDALDPAEVACMKRFLNRREQSPNRGPSAKLRQESA